MMDYDKYDSVQAELGAVSDTFKSNVQSLLASKELDNETRDTIECVCDEVANSLNQICRLLSHALQATDN